MRAWTSLHIAWIARPRSTVSANRTSAMMLQRSSRDVVSDVVVELTD
jgi:hypothetical protein